MEHILNNGWVVGIVGGVLSGLIVTWLTHMIFSKKDQKELAINISSANKEVLYALRPEVSEDSLPSIEVIEALRNATARKYKVEPERLHAAPQLVEELIKEIMDSSFISSSLKKQYCESLRTLTLPSGKKAITETVDREVFVARIEYKEKMTALLSMTLGTIAALATMASFFKSMYSHSIVFNAVTGTIFPMVLVMGSVILVMTAMQVALKLRLKKIRAENKIPDNDSTEKLVGKEIL